MIDMANTQKNAPAALMQTDWLKREAAALGFDDLRISDADLEQAGHRLQEWLAQGYHGDMDYMSRHANLRAQPNELHPGVVRIISVRMSYLPDDHRFRKALDWRDQELFQTTQPEKAVISVYARGRDYHKVLRQRLQRLADVIANHVGPYGYRVFVDSAPVMEVELAQKSGLGWRGKHTLLLNREAGSMFFLGEIFVDVPFALDKATSSHCGECSACIDLCPTQAIVAPYQVDARRCISYLTIENRGSIPIEFREAMGNRVYGCDDCQLVCPWNKFSQLSNLPDFLPRHGLDDVTLLDLWAWTQQDFERRHQGSAILRIGYSSWRRNLAVAIGNALRSDLPDNLKLAIRQALLEAKDQADEIVAEHIDWALAA
jgi:epoxyqueuosine reductase